MKRLIAVCALVCALAVTVFAGGSENPGVTSTSSPSILEVVLTLLGLLP